MAIRPDQLLGQPWMGNYKYATNSDLNSASNFRPVFMRLRGSQSKMKIEMSPFSDSVLFMRQT